MTEENSKMLPENGEMLTKMITPNVASRVMRVIKNLNVENKPPVKDT